MRSNVSDYIESGGYVSDLLQVILRIDDVVFRHRGKPPVFIDICTQRPEGLLDAISVGQHTAIIARARTRTHTQGNVVPLFQHHVFIQIYIDEVYQLADKTIQDGMHSLPRIWLSTAITLIRLRVLLSPEHFPRPRIMTAEHYHHLAHNYDIPRRDSLRDTEQYIARMNMTYRESDAYLTHLLCTAMILAEHSETAVAQIVAQ